jgi:hypothetical protein
VGIEGTQSRRQLWLVPSTDPSVLMRSVIASILSPSAHRLLRQFRNVLIDFASLPQSSCFMRGHMQRKRS